MKFIHRGRAVTAKDISWDEKHKFLETCLDTASALAADRASNFLPVQCLFIATVGIAVGRTKLSASGLSPSVFINVEAYSIAFSALYLYIVSTVILGSIIGVSQTESSNSRLLNSFCQQV